MLKIENNEQLLQIPKFEPTKLVKLRHELQTKPRLTSQNLLNACLLGR